MKFIKFIIALVLVFASPALAETTQKSARETIEKYYVAIDKHNYRKAFELWEKDESGKVNIKGQNYKDFKLGFANTRSAKVEIIEVGEIDAGMGHVYIQVKVHVTARDFKNTLKFYDGTYDLRARSHTFAPTDWKISNATLEKVKN